MKITKQFLLEDQHDGVRDLWLELKQNDKFYLKQNELNRLDNGQVYFVIQDSWSVSVYGVKSGFLYMYCSKAGVDAYKVTSEWVKKSGFKAVEQPNNPPHDQIKDPFNYPFKSE